MAGASRCKRWIIALAIATLCSFQLWAASNVVEYSYDDNGNIVLRCEPPDARTG